MPRTSDDWWDQPTASSRVKVQIVSKYADAWAGIMARHLKRGESLSYVDLFAGRGRYRNGELGTALSVLSQLASGQSSKVLKRRVKVILNPKNIQYSSQLRSQILSAAERTFIKDPPIVTGRQVDGQLIRDTFQNISGPAFWFLDPWGYEGITRALIGECTADWGCDALILLNVNAITRSVRNIQEHDHMADLFGKDYFERLLRTLDQEPNAPVEPVVMRTIVDSFRALGDQRLVSRVGFRFKDRNRHSHFLILVTKHQRGVRVFNDIVERELRESPPDADGVFVFNGQFSGQTTIELIARHDYLDTVAREVLNTFAGRRITFEEVLKESFDTDLQFSDGTLRQAVLSLEEKQEVRVIVSGKRIRRNGALTLPPRSIVQFPTTEDPHG